MSVAQAAPAVTVSTTSREITAHGGAVLLREVIRAVGVQESIKRHLDLKQRARGLSEAQFVASTIESIALGATCLDDLAVARADDAQTKLRGFAVPAPQTAGAWLRRFSLGHIGQLDKAMREIMHRALVLSGADEVTLDFDSSYISSRSKRRQGSDRTYKKGYALHPLFCFDASSGACVHARLRHGRAGAPTGMKTFLAETLRRVPAGVAIRARMDAGFYGHPLFAQLESAGVIYLCGVPLNVAIRACCLGISHDAWRPCIDKDEGEVAEFSYAMDRGKQARRFVVKRIARPVGEQLSLEDGGYHYWVCVTNDHISSPAAIESEHRHKALLRAEFVSSRRTSACTPCASMASWPTGPGCCWYASATTCAAGRRRSVGSKLVAMVRICAPSVCAIATSSCPPCSCAARGRLTLKLRADYPFLRRFLAALHRLRAHAVPAG